MRQCDGVGLPHPPAVLPRAYKYRTLMNTARLQMSHTYIYGAVLVFVMGHEHQGSAYKYRVPIDTARLKKSWYL